MALVDVLSLDAETEDRMAKLAREVAGEKAASEESEAERPEELFLILGDSALGLSSAAGESRALLES